ncbi:MAG: hypothetical protein R3C28_32695, partial [Pirellulaceae bacterium]
MPDAHFSIAGLELVADDFSKVSGQVIFLDFDGAEDVSYDGPVHIDGISIPAFDTSPIGLAGLEPEIIASVVGQLNDQFGPLDARFTSEQPSSAPYSTVYVGGDESAFSAFGSYVGLAEAVDVGNKNRNDEAFVYSEKLIARGDTVSTAARKIADVAAHEAAHLVGFKHDEVQHLTGHTVLSHVASETFTQDLFAIQVVEGGASYTAYLESSTAEVTSAGGNPSFSGDVILGVYDENGTRTPLLTVDGSVEWILAQDGSINQVNADGAVTLGLLDQNVSVFSGKFSVQPNQRIEDLLNDWSAPFEATYSFFGATATLDTLDFEIPEGAGLSALQLQVQGSLELNLPLGDSGGTAPKLDLGITGDNYFLFDRNGASLSGAVASLSDFDGDIKGLHVQWSDIVASFDNQAQFTHSIAGMVGGSVWRLQGKVVLPDVYNVTADFSNDNFIELRVPDQVPGEPALSSEWSIVGAISVEDVRLGSTGWGIDSAQVTFDTDNAQYSATGKISLPDGTVVDATLAFVGGEIDGINLNVNLDAPGKPLGTSGVFLQKAGGGVNGISAGAEIVVTGATTLTAGPTVSFDLPNWLDGGDAPEPVSLVSVSGDLTVDKNKISGAATVTLLDGMFDDFVFASGTLSSELNWHKGYFTSSGTIGLFDFDGAPEPGEAPNNPPLL